MLAKILSFGIVGIEAYPIEIEVDVSRGLPAINIIGLADTAIKESRERVKSAIKNSGFQWPTQRMTINLAPSDTKKEGTGFDLAIALGILYATGQINGANLKDFCILGELCLDGSLRFAKGILPVSMALERSGIKDLLIPEQNAKEAAIVKGVRAWPVKTLKQTVELLSKPGCFTPASIDIESLFIDNKQYCTDFSEIKGQRGAKRAIEVAVTGGHNIILIGPPGSGKSMLAKRIPTIMPDLDIEEALEITKIHSVAGTLPVRQGMISTRPFRYPHHSISSSALIGGGKIPRPGEISLSHNGVLFLDELPEFQRDCLEALRQPLEDGLIKVSRTAKSFLFPASFMLVCAMNPCPCGHFTDPKRPCRCNPNKIQNYLAKISGPLLDRIDIHIEVPAVRYQELASNIPAESSSKIKERIDLARLTQKKRFKDEGIFHNAQMAHKQVTKFCYLGNRENELLKTAMAELNFSARAYDKILKVSRTIADIAGSGDIKTEHLSEAIQYRGLDRDFF